MTEAVVLCTGMELLTTDALLVIDVQVDFCPGGALPVPDGDAILPTLQHVSPRFEHVIATQDWHPRGHISFASSCGARPLETIEVAYGKQTLWPDHCVQQTPGAALHPALQLDHLELLLRKGFRTNIDSYSAFLENDRVTPTGLAGYLRERGLKRLFFAGLAFDYCVGASALDGVAAGFECFVLEDATRGIAPASIARMRHSLQQAGVRCIHSQDL